PFSLSPVLSYTTLFRSYATVMGRRIQIDPPAATAGEGSEAPERRPSVAASFAPILVPVILIALKSVADYPTRPLGTGSVADFFKIGRASCRERGSSSGG